VSEPRQDRFARVAALRPSATRRRVPVEARGIAPEIPEGSRRLAELLGAAPARNRYGEHLVLRRWFSEPIGGQPPERSVDQTALRLLAPDAPADVADPQQWLFLDTETTGLAGGTGTYAFLVGIAWWDAGGLEVEQFFMRDHSEEHSVLLALAQRMAERRVLVTFNGKTFDWPLLETRYSMTRTIRPPAPRVHLDFLHPARSLWRLRLGTARLPELERHVLGWNRGIDVASDLIPAIYFDFLRGGPPDPLVPIFHHNQMDLRGLAGLAERVISLLADPTRGSRDGLELFGVSRICDRRGEAVRARELYAQSIASELPPDPARLARKALARLAKKNGEFPLACELWTQMAQDRTAGEILSREGLDAYLELAIHSERRARNPHRAAILVREALAELRRARRLAAIAPAICLRYERRFEKRLTRLDRKIADGLRKVCATKAESVARAGESNSGQAKERNSMPDSDSPGIRSVRISPAKQRNMPEITEPYLREQLERRRQELRQAIASPAAETAPAALAQLLREVDSALERMDQGTYGICEACQDTIERDRLISDPLVRLCLDHLSREEQRALEGDLELASRIQRGLLPQREVNFRDWQIHYEYKPSGLVSGDYCDLIVPPREDGTLIFLLGDVAGKGVAAALLMTHLHAMFRSLAAVEIDLNQLLDMGNRIFCESTIAGQYATLICGRAGAFGEIEIASAGHLPALLVGRNGVERLGSTGLPLGMFRTARYNVCRARLDPGDSLLLYTDGISEAAGAGGSEYGVERLALVAGEQYSRAPGDFVAACLADLESFSSAARRADDQTLMLIQRAQAHPIGPTGA
jgi:phosphoserine phosphatase RsbU/P